MKVISLKDARSLGLKNYYTGKPCSLGHIGERNVARRGCNECSLISSRTSESKAKGVIRHKDNREHNIQRMAQYDEKKVLNIHTSLNLLASKSPECQDFLDTTNRQRTSEGKMPLSGEYLFQHIVYWHLISRGYEVNMEVCLASKTDRYDLVLPKLKVILELKVGIGWKQYNIDAQLKRYKENNLDYTVLGIHPDSSYGLIDTELLLLILKENNYREF